MLRRQWHVTKSQTVAGTTYVVLMTKRRRRRRTILADQRGPVMDALVVLTAPHRWHSTTPRWSMAASSTQRCDEWTWSSNGGRRMRGCDTWRRPDPGPDSAWEERPSARSSEDPGNDREHPQGGERSQEQRETHTTIHMSQIQRCALQMQRVCCYLRHTS